jgi:hypothetical protein
MKAAVAVPPVLDFYFTPSRASALGAEAVRRILEMSGINTAFFNFPAGAKKPVRIKLPHELSCLEDHIIPGESGPLSFFSRFSRFGPDMSGCADEIAAREVGILFISCFAWAYANETADLAAAVKRKQPGIITAAGGPGVSVNPDYFRGDPDIDYVITGEAETALPQFLKNLYPGLSDDISPPDPGFYWSCTGESASKGIRYISACLTRGCPRGCRFCSNHLVHGRKFRKAAAEEVINELKKIPGNMNLHINFEDDNLLIDREYFFEMLSLIKTRFPETEFSAENGLDYTALDETTADTLIDYGFTAFNLSMASADRVILKKENRQSDSAKLAALLEHLKTRGKKAVTYFICGLGGDSTESVLENLLFLHRLPTLTGISLFYPVPGLPGFEPGMMSEFHPRLCAGSTARPWNNSLTTEQMITAFRLARLSNMIKTEKGTISPDTNFNSAAASELYRQIKKTGRLHTLRKKSIVEVPRQDREMVSGFISALDYLDTYG